MSREPIFWKTSILLERCKSPAMKQQIMDNIEIPVARVGVLQKLELETSGNLAVHLLGLCRAP